jgi:hypothetical protein
MWGSLDWLFVVFGCAGFAAAAYCLRLVQTANRHLRKVQLELGAVREDQARLQQRLDAERDDQVRSRQRFQMLLDEARTITDERLAGSLTSLRERVASQVRDLEEWRLKSLAPLQFAAEQAEQSKTVERRGRLAGFRDALLKANVELSAHVDRLVAVDHAVSGVTKSLECGDANPLLGRDQIETVAAILKALSEEERLDRAFSGVLRKRTPEFEARLMLHDHAKESDRRKRDERRIAAAIAFAQYKLPPLAPMEKFRALKTGGQRDGFG